MKAVDVPDFFPIPFADQAAVGYIRDIPTTPTGTTGQSSLQLGFPPANFDPVSAGGVPPFGQDFNGLNYRITGWSRWFSAGAPNYWESTFSTDIGGYPAGAIVSAVGKLGSFWLCLVDDNTSNPDAGGANWLGFGVFTRQPLLANTTYYVATTGSDSNDGLTPGTPWLTLQKAWNYIQNSVNLNGFTATVSVANGTYTAGLLASGAVTGAGTQGNAVIFQGNTVTPASCLISVTNGNCISAVNNAAFTVKGFKLAATGTGNNGCGIQSSSGSYIAQQSIDFGACGTAHMLAQNSSSIVSAGGYTISGSAPYHAYAQISSYIQITGPMTVSITGTPAFSSAFARASLVSVVSSFSVTYSGSATGSRYQADANGVVNTASSGATFLPGNAAGTTPSGGQYI
jgi:hypothetical protein